MTEQQQSHFEGWAIVEQMGHNRYAGFVTRRPEYVGDQYCPAGTTVKEGAVQGYTKYIGPGSLFALTPCSQEACLAAVEEVQKRPAMVLRLPETLAIGSGTPTNESRARREKPCGCADDEECDECAHWDGERAEA
jgi:hypothetical protein